MDFQKPVKFVVQNGSYHAWIERDDAGQSSFAPPNDNSHTIGSISSGHQTVVVGSYDAHKDATRISFFSSAGPTRDGRQKPELSARGHNVLAAHSRTDTGVTRKSGTSMASRAVTGSIALLLAGAQASGRPLAIGDIRDILTRTARKNPPPEAGNWDPQFGFGRVSAAGAAAQVFAPAPEPGAVAKRIRTAAKRAKAKAVRRGR